MCLRIPTIQTLTTALLVVSAFTLVPQPVVAEEVPVDLELVLAVDVSGSVDEQEAALQRDGYVQALKSGELIEAVEKGVLGKIAVTYIEWAGQGYQATIVDWTVIHNKETAHSVATRLADAPISSGPWTSISSIIQYSVPLFTQNAYQGTRRVIDISGDGPNNRGIPVTIARDAAIKTGIVINGLPIVNDRPQPFGTRQIPNLDKYFENCVIGGVGAFMVVAESFNDFARAIQRKLIFEIAALTPPSWLARKKNSLSPSDVAPVEFGTGCDVGEQLLRDRWAPQSDQF